MNKETTIKIKLLKKGIKQIDIACELGVTEAAISQYVNIKQKSQRFDDWALVNLGIDMDKYRKSRKAKKQK